MAAPLRAILFDLDGTLLDTAPDMVGALNALRREQHLPPLPFESVRSLVSHGAARLVKLGFPHADPETFTVLQQRYLEIYRGAISLETRLFTGMDRVLEELAQRRLVCGIVTNKPAWLTHPLLDQLGLTSRFACVVSGDTVSARKPHAMPMLHAAKLAGVAAGECIYVGDAERDIQAAHAADMQGLVAAYGYLQPDEDWQAWGGDGVIKSPIDLLPWLEHSGRL
ncbi:MAG TPA: HAD-IA family hydrolase [Steroidobacteraceae bacterium]|jgi:phosphoglycolate phosphatase|nr:HAD-IA family hydrolase [Steroidobacteraceae bacterium]